MSRYDLLTLPVVSGDNLLLGVITIDDLVDGLEDETTEDFQRLGGAQPLERAYLDTGILTVTRKRIGWLLLLFLTETLTGSVLRHFEVELQSVVALAFFVPLLIGTGGNAGSQTTSTIIQNTGYGPLISQVNRTAALIDIIRVIGINRICNLIHTIIDNCINGSDTIHAVRCSLSQHQQRSYLGCYFLYGN